MKSNGQKVIVRGVGILAAVASLAAVLQFFSVGVPLPRIIESWFRQDLKIQLSCMEKEGLAEAADETEIAMINQAFEIARMHHGELVNARFELLTPGSGFCARLELDVAEDEVSRRIEEIYDKYPGIIYISEGEQEEHFAEWLKAIAPERHYLIEAFNPGEWGTGRYIYLPQQILMHGKDGYEYGAYGCDRCYSGPLQVGYQFRTGAEIMYLRLPPN